MSRRGETISPCQGAGWEEELRAGGRLHRGGRSGPRLAFRDQASQVALRGQFCKEALRK